MIVLLRDFLKVQLWEELGTGNLNFLDLSKASEMDALGSL